jgi:acyl-CoA thioesterase-1
MKRFTLPLFVILLAIACSLSAAENKAAAKKGKAAKKQRPAKQKVDPALPMVLILGDSISGGYTKQVRVTLASKANVIHNPGNSQGTTHTLKELDKWLAMQDWAVIHFNLGLHDLKRVTVAGTSKNSNDPKDPRQADLPTYTANLETIVGKLKTSKAKLIFATTTPYPAGVKPHRDPADAVNYNTAAQTIMKTHGIPVNDLYSLVLPELKTLQKPVNVHFHAAGSQKMAAQVAEAISKALK